jgi:O-antigen/teichoic acid export membrane protein
MSLAHRVISGSMQLTLSGVVVRALSIATMPILTGLLSPQAYGEAALIGTVITLFSTIATAGLDVSYSRAYNSSQPPNGYKAEHACWRLALISSSIFGALSAIFWAIAFSGKAKTDSWSTALVGSGVTFSVLHTMTLTRARLAGRYRAMAFSAIGVGVLSPLISIGTATIWRKDGLALVFPILLGYLVPILVLGAPSFVALSRASSLNKMDQIGLVKIGIGAIVTAPLYWLLSSADRWFIQYYHGAAVVGIYSIGYSVGVAGMVVNGAVMSVWLPEALKEYEIDPVRAKQTLGKLMSRLVVAMSLVWLAVASAGGDVLVLLSNQRFHGASTFIPFIAGAIFFYGTSQLLLNNLVLLKELKWGVVWWIIGGLACTALNVLVVPSAGGIGAAIVQCVSFAIIGTGVFIISQRKYKMLIEWRRLCVALILQLVSAWCLIPAWDTRPAMSLLKKFPVGFTVAVLVSWVMAPDWYRRGIQILRGNKIV